MILFTDREGLAQTVQADLGLRCPHMPKEALAWCSPILYYIVLSFVGLIFEIIGCGSRSLHVIESHQHAGRFKIT